MTTQADIIGFGIVGCGLVSAFHARAIGAIPEARLIGFVDVNKDRAEQRAKEFNGVAFDDFEALLAQDDVHVINVCTPNGLHEDIVLRAAAAGKHVMVEKPPEITLERTDRMIAACKAAGVKFATVLQSRFRPSLRALKSAIEQGRLGRLLMGDIYMKWYRSEAYYRRDPWRGTKATEGGMLMQLAFHYLDLLYWLMGPVQRATARTARLLHRTIETEDTGIAILEFKNGAIGVLEASTAVAPGIETRLEIHGERGTVRIEGNRVRQWHIDGREDEQAKRRYSREFATAAGNEADFGWQDHQAQIRDMVDAIREDREPAITTEDGRNILALILAIYRSAETGKPVTLP